TEIYTLSLHDALPISSRVIAITATATNATQNSVASVTYRDAMAVSIPPTCWRPTPTSAADMSTKSPMPIQGARSVHFRFALHKRSEEHTSELQSLAYL